MTQSSHRVSRSCVKLEVAVLGFPVPNDKPTVSVDVERHFNNFVTDALDKCSLNKINRRQTSVGPLAWSSQSLILIPATAAVSKRHTDAVTKGPCGSAMQTIPSERKCTTDKPTSIQHCASDFNKLPRQYYANSQTTPLKLFALCSAWWLRKRLPALHCDHTWQSIGTRNRSV